ncbi:MAG: hypothetical protein KC620_22540, partial [Myxococcales bacterium]|nr:hypothetical protein [Myxococcales bacterium]
LVGANAEVCNGLDDDCDGRTDEGTGGAMCSAGVGVCRADGRRVCADGQLVCNANSGAPRGEQCNALDDDCDGRTDEDFQLGEACTSGLGVCAAQGVYACGDNGDRRCTAEPGAPHAEACNARDDDCDGTTDEGFANLNRPCTVGVGACRATGIIACTEDGAAAECSATAGAIAPETCNGVDDDCDGATDEAFADLFEPCNRGVGACARQGIRQCSVDGLTAVCSAPEVQGGAETCNGVDDDCDGRADEGFAALGEPCEAGQGLCRRQGLRVCDAAGVGVICAAMEGEPAPERCDGLDNDCDGRADEGFAGLGTTCDVGVGACLRRGVRVCSGDGAGVVCNTEAGMPAAETCNGGDDDCDGRTDEGFPRVGQPCSAGEGICRRAGVFLCRPDGLDVVCTAEAVQGRVERCDGNDDDCDGSVDEDWPDLGTACTAGEGICRRVGVRVCDPAEQQSTVCDAEIVAGNDVEQCDYQDDDCDGRTDEGFVTNGRYTTLAHCGACGTDCDALWAPDPAEFGVVPRCAVLAGAARCTFDCLPGRRDADGVPNNGCELSVDDDAVYVSTPANGGADGGQCGSIDRPCATIGFGLNRASALNAARVRVSEGVYRESVTLQPGIELLGGHQRTTWVRNPALNVTIITGNTPAGETHRWTVRAQDVHVDTRFDGFVVNGESPLLQGNAYAIYIADSDARLRVSNNRILAGNGGRGRDGAGGNGGPPGVPGQNGQLSVSPPNPNPCANDSVENPLAGDPAAGAPGVIGGPGGALVCGGVAADGGRGGYTSCPTLERQEGTGRPGAG